MGNEPDSVSSLVIGTESQKVLILDPSASHIVCSVDLGSVPAFLAVTGEVSKHAKEAKPVHRFLSLTWINPFVDSFTLYPFLGFGFHDWSINSFMDSFILFSY